MFLNGVDDKIAHSLLTTLSSGIKENKGFRAFVYFENKTPTQLKELHKKLNLGDLALCLIPKEEKASTMKGYKINPKAKSTVIVYKDRKVTRTFTNYDPAKDAKALKEAIKAVSSKK